MTEDNQEEASSLKKATTISCAMILAISFVLFIGGGVIFMPALKAAIPKSLEWKKAYNNLRQISNAANQYFIDQSANSVNMSELIGNGKYISEIKVIQGEDYSTIFPIHKEYDRLRIEIKSKGHSYVRIERNDPFIFDVTVRNNIPWDQVYFIGVIIFILYLIRKHYKPVNPTPKE